MSRPLPTCWQFALKPAKAHVAGTNEMTRGAMPGALNMRAAMELGRCAMTSCRNSGVSMKALTVSELVLRRPSYEKKKNALLRPRRNAGPLPSPKLGMGSGPPMEPPNWLRGWVTRMLGGLFGPPYLLKEFRPGLLFLRKRFP